MLLPLAFATVMVGAPASPADSVPYRGANDEIEIATPSVARADIDIDGRLDDAAWEQSALLTGFTQFEPVEGTPASQQTEVRVIVDADAIYFAIKAYDSDAANIRATLSERDSYTRSDDYVRLVLDTYNDQRRAFVFTVNPLGVQHDGIWNDSGGTTGRQSRFRDPIDDNPDFLWDSNGHILDWGYQIEIRIPFKSLRFPESTEQSWGLQIERSIQRNGFKSSWAPITQNVANRLAQSGKLNGLRDLDMGLFMELNPVLTGTRVGSYDEDLGALQRDDPSAAFGLNATYGVTSNLTLDATYNPDFSQVEADAGQISVNERFALFFPEKRPFFLEGTEIFGMAKQLVYTRSVQNPIGGAKLTGKIGSLNVGYLGAIDEGFDAGDNTLVNLVRLRQDVGASSSLGAVYTDRTESASSYNRVAGADARLQFGGRYTMTLMGASSFSDGPSFSERATGQLLHAKFERAGRTLTFNAEIEDTDSLFDASSGFFSRVGDTQVQSETEYKWFNEPGALLEEINPALTLSGFWNHDDFWAGRGMEEGTARLRLRFAFRDNITFWTSHERSLFSFSPRAYEGLYAKMANGNYWPFRADQSVFDNLPSTTVSLWVNKWQRVRGNVRYTWGRTPIFDRSQGVAIELANSRSTEVTLNLYPTRALVMEVGLRTNTLDRVSDGVEALAAVIPRIRAQYQFTRSLFVRGIFEYSSQERLPLRDPESGLPLYGCSSGDCNARSGSEGYDFHVEGLVSYEPSPGTVFYVGYTREMEDIDSFRFRDIRARADGLFVKLSYRFRM